MNKCEKCGFLHYRTDPCRKPKESGSGRKTDADRPRLPPKSASDDKSGRSATNPDRNKSRHRPGYFTEYMRDYRKGIRRSKSNPNTPERNDE